MKVVVVFNTHVIFDSSLSSIFSQRFSPLQKFSTSLRHRYPSLTPPIKVETIFHSNGKFFFFLHSISVEFFSFFNLNFSCVFFSEAWLKCYSLPSHSESCFCCCHDSPDLNCRGLSPARNTGLLFSTALLSKTLFSLLLTFPPQSSSEESAYSIYLAMLIVAQKKMMGQYIRMMKHLAFQNNFIDKLLSLYYEDHCWSFTM